MPSLGSPELVSAQPACPLGPCQPICRTNPEVRPTDARSRIDLDRPSKGRGLARVRGRYPWSCVASTATRLTQLSSLAAHTESPQGFLVVFLPGFQDS